MKKARIVLAAVAVMAIGGGIFASKQLQASEKSPNNALIYCSTTTTTFGTTLRNWTISTTGAVSYCTTTSTTFVKPTLITQLP